MIAPMTRLVVALIALILGTSLLRLDWPIGWLGIAVTLSLLWGYFRISAVPQAYRSFKAGDFVVLRRHLNQVLWPALLNATHRAYYHWLRGATLAADGQMPDAERHLYAAVEGKLRTKNDRSLVQCLRAQVALADGRPEDARDYLDAAQTLEPSDEVTALIGRIAGKISEAH